MEPIIDDNTTVNPLAWTAGHRGLVARDFGAMPLRAGVEMPTIPRSEWSDRIKQMESEKSRLSDIRMRGNNGQPIPSLDQNGQGYCWAYASGHAVTILRAVANLPYVPLSPHAVACKVKGFKDEGGWSALSLEYIAEHGIPSQEFWPAQSMSRQHDTPETWANAKLHRVTEGWVDVAAPVWDRNLSFEQVATCLLSRIPVACDFMWWGHAVCALDLVETSPGQFGVRIWNSWGDSFGDRGMAVLAGSKAIPDNAVAPRVVSASAA
jgi:hypothetical protein